jgi:hypothetical protein
MSRESATRREVTYPGHDWGALANDPWRDIVPPSAAWRDAVRRAWLRAGGSEAEYERIIRASDLAREKHGRRRRV